ncbi:MAG: hypothetical protein R3Y13_05860 [bacterium]
MIEENIREGVKHKNFDSLYILRIPYFSDDVEREHIYDKINVFLKNCDVKILHSDVCDKIYSYFNFSSIGKSRFEKIDILFIILTRVLKEKILDFDDSILKDMENILNKYYFDIKVLNEIYFAHRMYLKENGSYTLDNFYESDFLLNFKKNNFLDIKNRDLFMKCLIEILLEKKEYYEKLKEGMKLNDN